MSFFFFFKQKTAYEMRISDWSSDVCSSDLMGDLPELEITDQAGPGASTQQFVFVDASEARMLPVQAGTDAAYRTVVQIQYRRQQQMELVERNGGVNFAYEIEAEETIGVDLGGEDAIATTAISHAIGRAHV